jgi:hypothetical protein
MCKYSGVSMNYSLSGHKRDTSGFASCSGSDAIKSRGRGSLKS